MDVTITESEMDFGPYPKDPLFHIEKSTIYKQLNADFKIAEFVLLRQDKKSNNSIFFMIEAKASAPDPNNQHNECKNFILKNCNLISKLSDINQKKLADMQKALLIQIDDFQRFVADIHEKMLNTFSLTVAACMKRQPLDENEMSAFFRQQALSQAEFRCVLVVRKHEKAWLPGLQQALHKVLFRTCKLWNFGSLPVQVLNEELARKYGLIQ